MIAQNIQALRARDSLTQEALAERLGVSRQTVAKWESSEAVPDLVNAQALSRLFKVRLDDLVNHSEERAGYPIPPAGLHIFGIAKMGERGQIVIPKKAREVFGLETGSELLILGDESQGIALQRLEDAEARLEMFGRAVNTSIANETDEGNEHGKVLSMRKRA
ncbi:helix-turn-helix domain-containing protein [uncultured Adlercreutzia sp.]|uniref:helix-turn-helix domain-containing protein n=1 Tax=uncultured Adlercreutzia sp. TaxID=875803 RepID=UPI0026F3FA21|nr:helix-turn-helix domain-containing protein [uncultured Adlercreutzia sp.]